MYSGDDRRMLTCSLKCDERGSKFVNVNAWLLECSWKLGMVYSRDEIRRMT